MSVLNKFSSSSGVNHPAHGRVGLNGCSTTRSSICEIPRHKQKRTNPLRVASLNVATLRGISSEVVQTMSRRGIDLCCIQECRWRGVSARMIDGKDSRYKCLWIGNELGIGGARVLLAEKRIDKVFDVKRVSDRLIMVKMIIGEVVVTVLSVYARQSGLTIAEKELLYDSLQNLVQTIDDSETFLTHFMSLVSFNTPRKHVFGGYRKRPVA